ncbi:thiamine diphosphokinase [Thermosipho atlanticus]|uniref:Thiamine diphosphokinase n=1 Tax=Thermosipho atlanticus DSM 15807 TaxID=1123380 RepID=A0A1M5SF62_9BACT|nr:thiamine diphosphokinase [Thermosipho atlanticus]SHH37085.1 thiamine diphosphokinase [Thermosipho atlanticus DSM 15807]
MKASIVLNGASKELNILNSDLIIAVDGGANLLKDKGILPHVIIGDLDSIDKKTLDYFKTKNIKILKFPVEKDEIDCELAIKYAIDIGADEIEILNFDGERLDMILALFGLMKKYKHKIVARSKKVDIGVLRNCSEIIVEKNEVWSFIALCKAKISLDGFKYKFNGYMDITNPIGVSNVTISKKIKINVSDGEVIYFRWKKNP